ncbi:MAG: site-specific DNA-methyltransferase [Desulfobaccales bacterium]|nr:site-specific DNA-methyltransferase [Desulfobaccales bacterium]
METWAKIILGDSRLMPEVQDGAIDLVVTSPPYWHIKDYGVPGQIGYGQSLHEYLKDLYYTWAECFRILRPGGRLCLNIGDQFARSVIYGRYKVIPLHAEFIAQGERIGFDFMGAVIWQKKTTMNTTGGANVMGSYPYPPNGLVEIDYEFILLFKKPGPSKKVLKEVKEASKLTKEEWKEYFAGHWHFGGARQIGHEAMFPEELPRRLIKMFTFKGDTVLDPFLGSGTTVKVALELGRNAVGYEINESFLDIIRKKIGLKQPALFCPDGIQQVKRDRQVIDLPRLAYVPAIQDARPQKDEKEIDIKRGPHNKVVKIIDENTLKLDNGQKVGFLGVKIDKKEEALRYLHEFLLGRNIILKYQDNNKINATNCPAYVYLKNKIFVNSYLIKSGLGSPDLNIDHKYKKKFIQSWKGRG